ncbi:MAG: dihydroorotase [Rhodoferax sp.]
MTPLLIQGGRVIDPASGFDQIADVAVRDGRVVGIGPQSPPPEGARVVDAAGCIVAPGLVDLAVRLREPGHEHARMLESEMAATVAGGVTSLVCPPDTEPVLDEPGLVEMLTFRAQKLHQARVFPLGALTRGLQGEVLTEMVQLTQAGCIGFGQAEVPLRSTQVLLRALQYASTFGYTVWLRPQDRDLGTGVVASGPLATRMGLSGIPVAAETIAIHTIVELMRATGARVHLCRLSSAAGLALVRQARAEGLALSCDVSIHSLHLTDTDIGFFDSRARLDPPLRQQRDRDAIRAALADGTVDALVSDHCPVTEDGKTLPFAESEPGATGVELLLSLALKWAGASGAGLRRALEVLTTGPARVLGLQGEGVAASLGRLAPGSVADLCVFDPAAAWTVTAQALRSQGKHTPFGGYELPGRVRCTVVGGRIAFDG